MPRSNAFHSFLDELNTRFEQASSDDVLDAVINDGILGKIALVSSFGAESAVLLHMIAKRRKDFPVLLIDTEFLFAETIDYLHALARTLDLQNIERITPDPALLAQHDPQNDLHQRDQDGCCHLRKTLPLQAALQPYGGWMTGRKRYQSGSREALDYFEHDPVTHGIKVNPLIHWEARALADYMSAHDLPRHPLVAKGYPSIGCRPCTTQVKQGEAPRAGRWRGSEKNECGIHFAGSTMTRNPEKELAS